MSEYLLVCRSRARGRTPHNAQHTDNIIYVYIRVLYPRTISQLFTNNIFYKLDIENNLKYVAYSVMASINI